MVLFKQPFSILVIHIPEWNCGSYGNTMFKFLRNGQIVFQSSYTILHSHQQCVRVQTSEPSEIQGTSFSLVKNYVKGIERDQLSVTK